MESPSRHLRHVTAELDEATKRLILHIEQQDFFKMGLDVSAITAATTELQAIATAVEAGDTAAINAAVAAAQESGQAALDAVTGNLTSVVAQLKAAVTPASAPLAITPAAVSFTAGTAGTASVSISGGSPPYTATDLPSGVTFNGSTFVADATTVTGNATVVVSDSSTPALTGDVAISIA